MSHTAKLFMNGRSQAVRLPAAFRFEGVTEVYVRMNPETGEVILSPKRNGWDEFFALPCEEGLPEDWLQRDMSSSSRDPFADDLDATT